MVQFNLQSSAQSIQIIFLSISMHSWHWKTIEETPKNTRNQVEQLNFNFKSILSQKQLFFLWFLISAGSQKQKSQKKQNWFSIFCFSGAGGAQKNNRNKCVWAPGLKNNNNNKSLFLKHLGSKTIWEEKWC